MERIKSGIKGLDELIEGGFVKPSTILVTGGPGCGKTTFALQYLYNGAMESGDTGIYVSFEMEPQRIVESLKASFDWNIEKVLDKKLILTRAELYDFDKLVTLIEDLVEKHSASRMVIDPTTVLGLFFEKGIEVRRSLVNLDRVLKKLNCTTLLTCEVPEGKPGISAFGIEEFVSDGIVILFFTREGNIFSRSLTVRKMRATKHDTGVHPIEITKGGIVVYPTEQVFHGI